MNHYSRMSNYMQVFNYQNLLWFYDYLSDLSAFSAIINALAQHSKSAC